MTTRIPSSPLIEGAQVPPSAMGLQVLGRAKLAAAASTIDLTDIPQRQSLIIIIAIAGLSVAGVPVLRLGETPGSLDSANNYWHRNMASVENGNIIPGNYDNTGTASTNQWLLGHPSANTALARAVFCSMMSLGTGRVTGNWSPAVATGAAATIGRLNSGWGEWFCPSGSGAVRCMSVYPSAGGTLSAGSALMVLGKDL